MSNKYKTYQELKEELGNKFEEYMYNANIELLEKIDKAIEYIKEHNIIGTNKEYLPSWMEKCYSVELLEILGDKENER